MFQRLSLTRKILIGVVPLFLLFLASSVALHNHFQEREMMEQAATAARTYAEIIREAMVSQMITNYRVDERFLEGVHVISEFDTLHILTNALHFRQEEWEEDRHDRPAGRLRTTVPHDSLEAGVLSGGPPVFMSTGERFRAIVPFTATTTCQRCHDVAVGYVLGVADMHVSLHRITEAARGTWQRSLLIFVVFLVIALAGGTWMFRRHVGHPVERLVEAARAIGRGELEHAVPGSVAMGTSRDEIHFLAAGFEEMRRSLREKIGQLDAANASLSQRNTEVERALEQLRRAQEELVRAERLAVTGRMTAQLSHEINNPIHNIQSLLTSGLRKLPGDSPARELVAVALEEVGRMAHLTRQMLEFYRGSVVPMETAPLDLVALLRDLARVNEESLTTVGIRLQCSLPERLPSVRGAEDKLRQVFLNLILNARDAMPQGGILSIAANAAEGGVRVQVADTGVGIPAAHLGKVFDAFFTTKAQVSGVGLGLSVSDAIVRRHGGTITVASAEGRGATFTVYLPGGDHG
jgi:signal transduction histidine kinase